MDMAILLHDGLCWTNPTSICQSAPQGMSILMILPDGWESARFQALCVALGFSRFEGESTLPPQAGNASRWAQEDEHLIA